MRIRIRMNLEGVKFFDHDAIAFVNLMFIGPSFCKGMLMIYNRCKGMRDCMPCASIQHSTHLASRTSRNSDASAALQCLPSSSICLTYTLDITSVECELLCARMQVHDDVLDLA